MGEATRALLHWASASIALPSIAFAGRPFFHSAFIALRHGRTNMDVPISIGVLLVTGMSLSALSMASRTAFCLMMSRSLDNGSDGRRRRPSEYSKTYQYPRP